MQAVVLDLENWCLERRFQGTLWARDLHKIVKCWIIAALALWSWLWFSCLDPWCVLNHSMITHRRGFLCTRWWFRTRGRRGAYVDGIIFIWLTLPFLEGLAQPPRAPVTAYVFACSAVRCGRRTKKPLLEFVNAKDDIGTFPWEFTLRIGSTMTLDPGRCSFRVGQKRSPDSCYGAYGAPREPMDWMESFYERTNGMWARTWNEDRCDWHTSAI